MNSLNRRYWLLGLACAALTTSWLGGCGSNSGGSGGSGNGGGGSTRASGTVQISAVWPTTTSRLIPANTRSLKLNLTGNTAGLSAPTAQVLASGVASATFPGLIPGTYTLAVGAYLNSNGTGTLLASATNAAVVVKANLTTSVGIALASQVVSVTVALNPTTTDDVAAHGSLATLTAWTQAGGLGSMVPVDQSKVTWVSDTPTVATVQSTVGNAVTVSPVNGSVTSGSRLVQITGRYRELPVDKSAFATLTVQSVNPSVTLTSPANGAKGVSLKTDVTANFSKAMNAASLTNAFTLKRGLIAVAGQVSYLGTTATFNPTGELDPNTLYTATITTAAKDVAGDPLGNNFVWTFTTHPGPEPPTLGAAGAFNILAGSAVTNADTVSAPTTIEGLIGVYPGSSVSGLPTAAVPANKIHAGDTVANEAKVALLAAYNDAVANSKNAISLPGNLGGLTLAPGLYVNSSSTGISGTGPNAILHLDAQGDSSAVWIFKMGSTLITDPGTSIVLAGSAQAKNIFWQVGSSATLGTDSVFKGNVLADVSITLTTRANLQGRALTRSGAVTLDTNTLTLP